MRAEPTYALDSWVLSVELPTNGHDSNIGRECKLTKPLYAAKLLSNISMFGSLFGGCMLRAETLTWTLQLRSVKYPPTVPLQISLSKAPTFHPLASILCDILCTYLSRMIGNRRQR